MLPCAFIFTWLKVSSMAHEELPPVQSEGPKASWTTISVIATIVTLIGFYVGLFLIKAADSRIPPEVAAVTAPTELEAQQAAEAIEVDPAADAALLAGVDGANVYRQCAACHQPTGEGVPGAFPPLNQTDWVTGDPAVPVRVVMYGLRGPITVRGNTYSGMMPPLGLNDVEIAAVVNYIRTAWDNQADAIDVAFVRNIRNETRGRTTPWTAAELGK
jgi:mono/diheme cytochrome c family protein